MIIPSLNWTLLRGPGDRLPGLTSPSHHQGPARRRSIGGIRPSWTLVGCLLLTSVLFGRLASCGDEARARYEFWQPDVVRAVAFSPDGRLLASGRDSGVIQLWDVDSGAPVARLSGHLAPVRSLHFTRDGRQVISVGGDALGQRGEVLVWDTTLRRLAQVLPWQGDYLSAAALSPDGQVFAAGGTDGLVHFWNVGDWSVRTVYRPHPLAVLALCFAPDGQRLITAGADDTIKVWHLDDGKVEASFHAPEGGNISALAVAPDGKTLVTGHVSDQRARIWDVPSGQLKGMVNTPLGHPRSAAFSPDGSVLALAAGLWRERGDVSLRPTRALGERTALDGHGNVVYCVAFSPDGRLLATGSADESVRLWDMATSRTAWVLRTPAQSSN